jgi:hypothetical protein
LRLFPLNRLVFPVFLGLTAVLVSLPRCAVVLPDDDGGASDDGGPAPMDGGRSDGGRVDGGRVDGGRADGGMDGGAMDGGAADGGAVDGGGMDGGPADGGMDGGAPLDGGGSDGGASDGGAADGGVPDCGSDAGVGTTTCGSTKAFETADPSDPSAFDFAQGRAMYLSTEVNPTQGDFYVASLDRITGMTTDNLSLLLVSADQNPNSGGERGVYKATGIEDLTMLTDGGVSAATFQAVPPDLVFEKATTTTTHRVLVREGSLYVLQLNFGAAMNNYGAIIVDKLVTPTTDGGLQSDRQYIEFRWLYQSTPNVRTFDRGFPPLP